MAPEKIIDRVQKLLALASNNPSPEEAASAAALAAKLMLEHKIGQAELAVASGAPEEDVVEEDVGAELGLREIPSWRSRLLTYVARAHGCRSLQHRHYALRPRLTLIGRTSDVQTASYVYSWLCAEIDQLVRRHGAGRGRGWCGSFRHGCVSTIGDALHDAQQAATVDLDASTAGGCTALVRRDAAAVAKYMERYALRPGRRVSLGSSGDGYARGREAGRSVDVRSGGRRGLGAPAKQIGR